LLMETTQTVQLIQNKVSVIKLFRLLFLLAGEIISFIYIGRVVGFSSGEENSHYNERVTEGHRFAFILGFTCDAKYAMKDPRI